MDDLSPEEVEHWGTRTERELKMSEAEPETDPLCENCGHRQVRHQDGGECVFLGEPPLRCGCMVYVPQSHQRPASFGTREDGIETLLTRVRCALQALDGIQETDDRVNAINRIRDVVAEWSPFKSEPVDSVRWVPAESVTANDYNPNSVAPPEMELLRLSIMADGYTQPIVANQEGEGFEVIDGFHRNRVGRECEDVAQRIKGFLPVVQIRSERVELADRMASTIRHNRARGRHQVEAMSDIVMDLKRRNWSDSKIGKELGMDPDEVLRLAQVSGLVEAFADRDFSQSWEAVDSLELDDLEDG